MEQFIKTCKSSYGNRTCIYQYVNVNQIIDLHISQTEHETNVEAILTNGQRVIILYKDDLINLLGKECATKLLKEMEEQINENRTK